jgi:hypothetical protein
MDEASHLEGYNQRSIQDRKSFHVRELKPADGFDLGWLTLFQLA